MDSMWYWPSRVELTMAVASSSRTSPSLAQKLMPSSYFVLQVGQYFIGDFDSPSVLKQHFSRARVCLSFETEAPFQRGATAGQG
jgi:hypothetical protein